MIYARTSSNLNVLHDIILRQGGCHITMLAFKHYNLATKVPYLTNTALSCSVTLLWTFLLLPNSAPITNEAVYKILLYKQG
jgi:hypothetical protein